MKRLEDNITIHYHIAISGDIDLLWTKWSTAIDYSGIVLPCIQRPPAA